MNESFSNTQVPLDAITKVENLAFSSLEKNYRLASILSSVIFFLIFSFILLGAWLCIEEQNKQFIAVGMVILAALFIFSFIMTYAGFKKKLYALREKDVIYKSGLIWQSEIVIPFNRVQHCEINQGPIDRMLKLAELKVFTAGGSSSDLTIPGLNPQRAQDLKSFIISKTEMDEEE